MFFDTDNGEFAQFSEFLLTFIYHVGRLNKNERQAACGPQAVVWRALN
jgi:hypothetical protein